MITPKARWLSTLAVLPLLAALALPAFAADRGRREAARSETPRTAARATPARPPQAPAATQRTSPRTAPRQTAAGRASYGHGSPGGYGGYGGWYPGTGWYGYPWWSVDLYWGWPVWGPWAYGYGPPRYAVEGLPTVYGDRGPALVELDVSPRRATVLVDGESAGRVKDWDGRWDRLPLDAGERVISFESPGYKTLRVRLDAAAGGFYRLAYDLAPGEGIDSRSSSDAAAPPARSETPPAGSARAADAPRAGLAKGFLRINVTPPDAAVYLDGSYFARADELARLRGAVPLAVGTHTLEIVRPGFENRKVEVEVVAERPVEVELELQRAP